MIRPVESDYTSPVAYARALEYYCNQLEQQAEHLKTVMIAAAEEISKHWDAHCDEEGYGPINLLRRLESGIPAQYGYSAGDFQRLRSRQWVGLTKAEMDKIISPGPFTGLIKAVVSTVESRLREKNT